MVNEDSQNTVLPGTIFVRLRVLVKVILVYQQNKVICNNEGQCNTISINEALELIDEYIS